MTLRLYSSAVPGAGVESVYFDGKILLSIGGLGITVWLMIVGVKIISFLPESLSSQAFR